MTEAQRDAVREAYRMLMKHLEAKQARYLNPTLKAITHLEEAFEGTLDLQE